MAHDYDVDMGLLPGHEDPSTIASWLRSIDGDVEVRPGRIVLTTAAGVKVDLFFHIERDGLLWHHTDIHEWWNTAFSLTEHEVDGVRMWRPDDAERYLFENYGPGWTRRSVFYDMSFDTPNRRYSETPEALSYLTFRLLLALENRDRWVYERCANALDEHFDIAVEPSSTPTTAAAR